MQAKLLLFLFLFGGGVGFVSQVLCTDLLRKGHFLISHGLMFTACYFWAGFGYYITRQFCSKWHKFACWQRVLPNCYWTQHGWKELLYSPSCSHYYHGSGKIKAPTAISSFMNWVSFFSFKKRMTVKPCEHIILLTFLENSCTVSFNYFHLNKWEVNVAGPLVFTFLSPKLHVLE